MWPTPMGPEGQLEGREGKREREREGRRELEGEVRGRRKAMGSEALPGVKRGEEGEIT